MIADFGISRLAHITNNSTTLPPMSSKLAVFIAPEIRSANLNSDGSGDIRPDIKGDIYSCGIVLGVLGLAKETEAIHVYSGLDNVYNGVDNLDNDFWTAMVDDSSLTPPEKFAEWPEVPKSVGAELWNVVKAMATIQPVNRLTVEAALIHVRDIFRRLKEEGR